MSYNCEISSFWDFLTRIFAHYTWQASSGKDRSIVENHIRKKHSRLGIGYDGNVSGRAYDHCKKCPVIERSEWCWDGTITKDYFIKHESNLVRRDFIN